MVLNRGRWWVCGLWWLLSYGAVQAAPGEVVIHLERLAPGGGTISFGVPVIPGAVRDLRAVELHKGTVALPARIEPLLSESDGLHALLVQLPASALTLPADVTVLFAGHAHAVSGAKVTYADVAFSSTESARVATRTITAQGSGATLVEAPPSTMPLFEAREPRVLATFPPRYLASTNFLGAQVTAAEVPSLGLKALGFISTGLAGFAGSAIYDEAYALNPDPESVVDPKTHYEGWLYDRCATFLLAYTHTGETRFLRHALRACDWYAREIEPSGWHAGYFRGKPDVDIKYSHLRGLYAYYALTGDERVLVAGRAIADRWLDDPHFVVPYRQGHARGPDRQWTERLLADALESLIYGYRLLGDARYLTGAKELFATAYRHITGDAATLAQINPGVPFPPQSCFIHSALQHGEGAASVPWCSAWMSELLVDPLLRYRELTHDARVDEVLIRLTRFVRDVGSAYFHGNPLKDHFLQPSYCDQPSDANDRRHLVPLYGAGVDVNGQVRQAGEFEDEQHCLDASALVAAGIAALRRSGGFDQRSPKLAPFATEGASFVQLEHELLFCAQHVLETQTRPARAPGHWKASELVAGLSNPSQFIATNKIGFPLHAQSPERRLSWWFNTALEEFSLLHDARVTIDVLTPGRVPGPPCPR